MRRSASSPRVWWRGSSRPFPPIRWRGSRPRARNSATWRGTRPKSPRCGGRGGWGGPDPASPADTLAGFETTSAEFGDVEVDPAEVPSLREDVSVDDVAPIAELAPTGRGGARAEAPSVREDVGVEAVARTGELEPTVSEEASAAEVEEELEPLLDVE